MFRKIIKKYLIISCLTLTLILGFSPSLFAQIPFFPINNNTTDQFPETPSWDLNKAYRCGKYWCSNVFLVGSSDFLEPDLLIALPSQEDKPPAEIAFEIEQRAKFVQNIYRGIIAKIDNSQSLQLSNKSYGLKFWLFNNSKPLHPETPLIEVGKENNQTVVYIPAKPEFNIGQQAIITVTKIDARANVMSIEELAEKWRSQIRKSMSDAIWGMELNRQYPFCRLYLTGMIILLLILFLWLIKFLKKFIKHWQRNLRAELKNIKQVLTVNPEAKPHEAVEVSNENNYNLSFDQAQNQAQNKSKATEQEYYYPETLKTNIENLDWIGSIIYKIFHKGIENSKQVIAEVGSISSKILPQTFQEQQNILKQEINIAQLILRVFFLSEITVILFAIGSIVSSFRETRFLFNLFFSQAIVLPIIWILMILTDKFVDFWIDYSLNQWAEDKQNTFPNSNRPILRVNTYSPAFQGATTILFTSIGLFLTFYILGINPSVIAGAGAVAVVFAFISRNLLEDMLNGILILATDRYAVGDVIEINGLIGCVEEMNVYSTSLRNLDGQLIIIPNGKVSSVINMTKNWSQVNFTIKISWQSDMEKAMKILNTVAEQMYQEAEWQEKILQPAEILGIEEVSHEGIIIRLLIKTQPAEHWNVGREFRLRVKQAFDTEGIILGIPQREIWHHHNDKQNGNYYSTSDDYETFVN